MPENISYIIYSEKVLIKDWLLLKKTGMERFVKGDIVVLPFPFSDLTSKNPKP